MTFLESLVNLFLETSIDVWAMHQMIEERSECDSSCIAACKECAVSFLFDVAPREVHLFAILFIDVENLLGHVRSIHFMTGCVSFFHQACGRGAYVFSGEDLSVCGSGRKSTVHLTRHS